MMRGIIFDLDDTLYPRASFVRSGFEAVARYAAHSWRLDYGAVLADLIDANANGHEGHEFQRLCASFRLPLSLLPVLVAVFRGHTPAIALDPAVRQTLQSLRGEGWRLVVLTNGDPGVQRRKVAALGIDPLVDDVVYANEHASAGKPDPAVFRVALDRLQSPPGSSVCVGDDPICDISGARVAGLRTIRVARRGTAGIHGDADAVVATVVEVPAIALALMSETADAA